MWSLLAEDWEHASAPAAAPHVAERAVPYGPDSRLWDSAPPQLAGTLA